MRTQRLQSEKKERIMEQKLEAEQKRLMRIKLNNLPSIIGKLFLILYIKF